MSRLSQHWPTGLSVLILVAAGGAQAATLDLRSKIDRVTLYPDAANVTRVAEIDVPAGATSLVLRGLPATVDSSSLRVSGEGSEVFTIVSLQSRLAPSESRNPDTAVEVKLRDLRSQREGWQVSLDAMEAKQAMIRRFASAGPEKIGPDAAPLDIDRWSSAWAVVGQGLAKVGDELRSARASAKDLDDQIHALEIGRGRPGGGYVGPETVVSIDIDARAPIKGRIAVSYRVAGANWRPSYDARLTTGSRPSLELVRRAAVSQRTGEDWSNVTLAVSTVRAARGTQAPEVRTQRLGFPEPQLMMMRSKASPLASDGNVAQESAAPAAMAAAPAPTVAATEQSAVLDAGAYQATFQIPGRLDVPGDGSSRSLRIATRSLTPDLVLKSSPALDPTAFLQAHFVNEEDAPLLPGEVALERDGTMVGRGRIALVAPGDGLDLGFGADDRVKITRAPVRRKENEPTWFGQTKVETREFKTNVRNLHDFPVRIAIVDQVPISENSAITIETLPATTPPADKNIDDRRGVLGWSYDLAAGDSKEIRLAYRMKWPADREVTFVTIGK